MLYLTNQSQVSGYCSIQQPTSGYLAYNSHKKPLKYEWSLPCCHLPRKSHVFTCFDIARVARAARVARVARAARAVRIFDLAAVYTVYAILSIKMPEIFIKQNQKHKKSYRMMKNVDFTRGWLLFASHS